jgi:hypothetical protein
MALDWIRHASDCVSVAGHCEVQLDQIGTPSPMSVVPIPGLFRRLFVSPYLSLDFLVVLAVTFLGFIARVLAER